MNIALACDHAGFPYKEKIADLLKRQGHAVSDFGCTGLKSCDYPDFGIPAAQAVASKKCDRGILVCGTGIGMSIAANKVPGARAAVCWNDEVARLCMEHNNANILCLPARFASVEHMLRWIGIWLAASFSPDERHHRRMEKIADLEQRYCEGKK